MKKFKRDFIVESTLMEVRVGVAYDPVERARQARHEELDLAGHMKTFRDLESISDRTDRIDFNTGLVSAGMVGGTIGVFLGLAINAIRDAREEYNWEKNKCNDLLDTNEIIKCKRYLKSEQLQKLAEAQKKCNGDSKCISKLQTEMNKIRASIQ